MSERKAVFINDRPLIMTNAKTADIVQESENELVLRFRGKKKEIQAIVDVMEKTQKFDKVYLSTPDLDELWELFQNYFKIISAAGGVVFNDLNQFLAISRRGFLDLPKGKIDKGETPEQAALREVKEETGLDGELLKPLMVSYHTYKAKDKRVLKPTHWYVMKALTENVVIQTEEDIEASYWMTSEEFLQSEKAYLSLKEVIKTL